MTSESTPPADEPSDDAEEVSDLPEQHGGGVERVAPQKRLEEELAQALSGESPSDATSMARELRRLLELAKRARFQGPLPPPEIIEGYVQSYPQAAEIIFKELQAQGSHRREIEDLAVRRQEQRADRGQVMAFVIVLAALAGAIALGVTGHGGIGLGLFGVTLAAIVVAFLRGTRSSETDLATKTDDLRRALGLGGQSARE